MTSFNYIVNPSIPVSATYDGANWNAVLPGAIYNRYLTGLSVQGPPNSQLKEYLGPVSPANLIDQTQRGNSNTADYSGAPRFIPRSQFVTVQWTPLGGTFTGTEQVLATFFVSQAP